MARPRKLPEGMRLRGKTYYAWFRAHGRLVQKRLSTDFRVACELLRDLRARADKAEFDILDNDYSIAELKRQYLKHCDQSLRPRTAQRYRENLANVLGAINATRVNHLTAESILGYRQQQLTDGKSPRSINMDVGALSTMLRWGVQQKLIGSNPIANVKPLATDQKRKQRRALTEAEVLALFNASPPGLREIWRTFMVTGIRHDELVEMRFCDVDFDRKTVTVWGHTAKNGKSREIPLDDDTLATIAQLKAKASARLPMERGPSHVRGRAVANFSREHVFVTGANTPWRNHLLERFYACCKKAGIEDAQPGGAVDIHSLRASFATLSIDNGASPKAVQAILGHSTLAMTMTIYAKATERAKRQAVAALPFAKVSNPSHMVSMPDVDTTCTSPSDNSQSIENKGVA